MTKNSNIATPPKKRLSNQITEAYTRIQIVTRVLFCFACVCVGILVFCFLLFVYVLLWPFVLLVRLLVSLFQSSKLSREKWAKFDILKRQESIGMCIVIKV